MIRCIINNMVYIGSSVDIVSRQYSHRSKLQRGRHHSQHFQNSWNKYGADAFEWSILEYIQIDGLTVEEAKLLILDREQYYIDMFQLTMFNTCYKAKSTLGRKHTKESKAKISAALIGKPAHNKGKTISEEQKQKLRTINLGKRHSEETKAKMSAANVQSIEARAKNSASHIGKRHSEETKAKISATYWSKHKS